MGDSQFNSEQQIMRAEARLAADFDQAWEHHRHLSDKGIKYMDRFMALAAGVGAFCAALMGRGLEPGAIPLFSVILFVVYLLCLSITRSISANRFVIGAYDHYFLSAVDYYYGGQDRVPCIWDLRAKRPQKTRFGPFNSADFDVLILYVILHLFSIAQVLIGNECLMQCATIWYCLVPYFFAISSLILTTYCFHRLYVAKQKYADIP